jgi:hypothetical protein
MVRVVVGAENCREKRPRVQVVADKDGWLSPLSGATANHTALLAWMTGCGDPTFWHSAKVPSPKLRVQMIGSEVACACA